MKRAAIFSTLLITAACTQPAAMVELKGSQSFGKAGQGVAYYNGNSTGTQTLGMHPAPVTPVAYNAPVSMGTSQNASVGSISSSDLAPPSGAQAAAAPASNTTQPVTISSNDTAAPVNQWTKKPRADEAAMAAKETGSDEAWSAKSSESKSVTVAGAKYIWPTDSHDVISSFGAKGAGKANDGINIAAKKGDPVWAAGDGEVVYASSGLKGYGNMVLIKHAGGKTTAYAHMARMTVAKYDRIKQGDIIGYVGQTGNVKSPQLHFAMRNGNDAVDPAKYVNQAVASN
jgi:murein DD-endopeptidase MepM/ murein hydrolase activator NlpD